MAEPATASAQTTSPSSSPGTSSAPSPSAPSSPGVSAPSPSAPSPDVSSAPSSGADSSPGDTREGLLAAVQQAVETPPRSWEHLDGTGGRASPAHAAQSGQAADKAAQLPDEVTNEELNRYPENVRARIFRLANERRRLQGEVERLKSYEPSAKAAESVTQYLRQHDIGREDFLQGLDMMATLRRGDFQRFYAGMLPYMRLAEEYLGISLPPDLQEQVQQGQMTTQAAAQYSRERMQRAMYQNSLQRQQQAFGEYHQQTQAQQQRAAKEILAKQVSATVNAWEARVARSDPDYLTKKQAAVQDTVFAVVREKGVPHNPAQAVLVAQEALRRVNAHAQRWAPSRRPTMRVPSSTGRTPGVTPEPRNLSEAIAQARLTAPRL